MYFNKLGLFSLLALLGVLGLATENKGVLGFFGFAFYLGYFWVLPDELFRQNVRKAATAAFFFQMLSLLPICLGAVLLGLKGSRIAGVAFASSFAVGVILFSLYLTWMEWQEKRCA